MRRLLDGFHIYMQVSDGNKHTPPHSAPWQRPFCNQTLDRANRYAKQLSRSSEVDQQWMVYGGQFRNPDDLKTLAIARFPDLFLCIK